MSLRVEQRYFFAVTPPEPLRGQIEAFRGRWGHPHHRVEPHVTIKAPFRWPGRPEEFLAPVRAACRQIEPFEVQLGAPARFERAQVLYLSMTGAGLLPLHRAVKEALRGVIPPDPRVRESHRFVPHLTLAAGRFGIDEEGLDAMEAEARRELTGLPPFTVTSLRCYRWEVGPGRWYPFCDLPLGAGR
ncbi:MAG TPA: 2'-5' RNA ligase family protein [Symbiobacteriaceae bacterium]